MDSSRALPEARGAWQREGDTVVLHQVPVPEVIPEPFAIVSESVFVSAPLEFGLMIALVGAPYFVWLLGRMRD